MATMTVTRDEVTELLRNWLSRGGNGSNTVEIDIQPGQVVIKHSAVDENELQDWLKDVMSRYDLTLRRLSDA